MTTKLKYRPAAPTNDEPRVLRFPGAVRDVVGRPDPGAMSAADLASSMESTLDRMQSRLDMLRRELGGAYHLPTPPRGGGRRPAA